MEKRTAGEKEIYTSVMFPPEEYNLSGVHDAKWFGQECYELAEKMGMMIEPCADGLIRTYLRKGERYYGELTAHDDARNQSRYQDAAGMA